MSYTGLGYQMNWHLDGGRSLAKADQIRLSRTIADQELPIEVPADFPEDIIESRSISIYASDLDRLATSVGWRPRGSEWEGLLAEATKVVSLWHQSGMLIGFARMVRTGDDAVLSDGMIHPKFQSMAYFRLLIERGIREMQEDGVQTAHLDSEPNTQRMYRHLGWEATNDLIVRP